MPVLSIATFETLGIMLGFMQGLFATDVAGTGMVSGKRIIIGLGKETGGMAPSSGLCSLGERNRTLGA